MEHWREKRHDRRDTASGVILRLHYLNRADGVFRMPDVDLIREMRLYYVWKEFDSNKGPLQQNDQSTQRHGCRIFPHRKYCYTS